MNEINVKRKQLIDLLNQLNSIHDPDDKKDMKQKLINGKKELLSLQSLFPREPQ